MTVEEENTLNPDWNEDGPRFKVCVRGYEPEDEPNWQYKLYFFDHKYLDCDDLPVLAIAAGDSWEAAYATVGYFIKTALASDKCVF